tara:strand:- start:10167 stop:10376 length:210 start_codon:yes stop_codon:yes gene_type:complete
MKSLFERLKADYKGMLLLEYKDFPASTEKGIEDLKTNFYVSDLKYGTVVVINNLDCEKAKASAWDYFND